MLSALLGLREEERKREKEERVHYFLSEEKRKERRNNAPSNGRRTGISLLSTIDHRRWQDEGREQSGERPDGVKETKPKKKKKKKPQWKERKHGE